MNFRRGFHPTCSLSPTPPGPSQLPASVSRPTYQNLLTVLPCHSLEDFPLHLQGDLASSLLACWTAPWHPSLLDSARQLPAWCRPDQLPALNRSFLVLVPLSVTSQFPITPEQLSSQPARILLGPCSRAAIWSQLGLDNASPVSQPLHASTSLEANDFAALGYAYLQIQLLTRRLRYTHTLDEEKFTQLTLAAASAHLAAQPADALDRLQAAFDLLLTERNRYYPVDAQLIELLLLDAEHPPAMPFPPRRKVNLLLPPEAASRWADEQPDLLAQLASAAQDGRTQILGSTRHQLAEPLLATAPLLAEYQQGREDFLHWFGLPPTVFGRRSGSFHPAQPQILHSLGYRGALHLPLSADCRLPPAAAATLGWQGLGQQTIDAISGSPRDAASPTGFLDLAIEIGQQVDSAHQATLVFAHWPNQTCEPFEDLVRIARLSSLLGRFASCDDLFDTLYHPSYGDRFDYDDYRANSLSNWIAQGRVNPISSLVEYQRLQAEWLALRHAHTMLAPFLSNVSGPAPQPRLDAALDKLPELALPPLPDHLATWEATRAGLCRELLDIRQALTSAAAACLATAPPAAPATAITLLNPHFAPRRIREPIPADSPRDLPPTQAPVLLVERLGNATAALVDLPASGLTSLPRGGGQPGRKPPSMVTGQTIRNEYFELEIDPQSGGIRRLRTHQARQTLLSQRLGLLLDPARESPDDPQAGFARMQADSVSFDTSHPLQASCLASGTLVEGDVAWARFRQQLVVTRGLRTIDFLIELELLRELDGKPWEQYICSRLAWSDEPLGCYRGLHDTQQPVRLEKFLAPAYLLIDNGHLPLTLLCDGLPWHRRSGLRVLDSLLVVAAESARQFRFGIGVGLDSPQHTAAQRGSLPLTFPSAARVPAQQWLFHLAARNLCVVDSWPTWDSAARNSGAVLRIRESLGKSGQATLYAPRKLKGARLLDLVGNPLEALTVTDDQVVLEYHGYKLFTLQLYW